MKRYLFGLHCQGVVNYHEEMFECDADAQIRARKILNEGKRDANAFMISVYRIHNSVDWRLIVSYQ